MSFPSVCVVVVCCPLMLLAQATPKTVFEGKREALYADSWASPQRWVPAECTVKASKEHVANARPTLHMHVPVDHHAGEKNYPIGWPRMGLHPREPWEKDWTSFERFEFMVYVETSRDRLPNTPITLILYCPDRNRQWSRVLRELKVNQWVDFSLPIAPMGYADRVARVAFAISESNYKHGDQLHFYIGAFRFVRWTECRLNQLAISNAVLFEGQATLDVDIEVEGVPRNTSRAVPFTIRRGKALIREQSLPVHRGRYTLPFDISKLKLPPDTYTLEAFADDADRARSATFRVVANPWKQE